DGVGGEVGEQALEERRIGVEPQLTGSPQRDRDPLALGDGTKQLDHTFAERRSVDRDVHSLHDPGVQARYVEQGVEHLACRREGRAEALERDGVAYPWVGLERAQEEKRRVERLPNVVAGGGEELVLGGRR